MNKEVVNAIILRTNYGDRMLVIIPEEPNHPYIDAESCFRHCNCTPFPSFNAGQLIIRSTPLRINNGVDDDNWYMYKENFIDHHIEYEIGGNNNG